MQPNLNDVQNRVEIRNQQYVYPALLDISAGVNFGVGYIAHGLFFQTLDPSFLSLALISDLIGAHQYDHYPRNMKVALSGSLIGLTAVAISGIADPVIIVTLSGAGAACLGLIERKFKIFKF